MVHTVRDVPYTYKGHHIAISKVKGWHCLHCREVEFDAGEGVRFTEVIKQAAEEIDAREAAELARIRKKLKMTQQEAALLVEYAVGDEVPQPYDEKAKQDRW